MREDSPTPWGRPVEAYGRPLVCAHSSNPYPIGLKEKLVICLSTSGKKIMWRNSAEGFYLPRDIDNIKIIKQYLHSAAYPKRTSIQVRMILKIQIPTENVTV